MAKFINFFVGVSVCVGASSHLASMEDPLQHTTISNSLKSPTIHLKKREGGHSRDLLKEENVLPSPSPSPATKIKEKERVIDKEIQEVEGYINSISRHFSHDKKEELENDSDIKNYRSMIEELKRLKKSILLSHNNITLDRVKQMIDEIQTKYYLEDDEHM